MTENSDLKQKVNNALNECKTLGGQVFELFTSLLVVGICLIFVIDTYPIPENLRNTLALFETLITTFFLLEYIVRWWAKSFSIKHVLTPLAIIDLLAILPLFLESHWQFVRLLRLFRIVRLLRVFQHKNFFFAEIIEYHLRTLKIFFTLSCLIFISSGLIFDVESQANSEQFSTFFDALYFSVVTLATLGFGDITPLSVEGKIITLIMIMSGAILIPWQIGDLIRSIIISSEKKKSKCTHCQHPSHDYNAEYCKMCGKLLEKAAET
jgi:voltage-gated potassium channel